jgi:hypothetical protein
MVERLRRHLAGNRVYSIPCQRRGRIRSGRFCEQADEACRVLPEATRPLHWSFPETKGPFGPQNRAIWLYKPASHFSTVK